VDQNFIKFKRLTKDYGKLRVVENLDLNIAEGEFVSLLGPSGSGKTTLLMMLAGFESITDGTIELDGQVINRLPTYKRDMGVVFQNYALFPHMTVAENVAFPLRMRGKRSPDQVRKALDMVQLSHLGDRFPGQLSGGQQQRVALARALVFEPRVVLMDEPLGALDKQLRQQMQLDIRDLHRRLNLTIIFVTYDQDEALTMSDRISVINNSQIQQCASPREVYDFPSSRFVAEFIGETNLLEGIVRNVVGEVYELALADGTKVRCRGIAGLRAAMPGLLSLRPERLDLRPLGKAPLDVNVLVGEVVDVVYQGDHIRVALRTALGPLIARSGRREAEWPAGAQVAIWGKAADGWWVEP